MGTRNLICIFYRGRFVVAQYGQWDGYPEGQGLKILEFISTPGNIQRLKDGLEFIDYIDKEELTAIYDQAAAMEMEDDENDVSFSRTYVSPMERHWPPLSRDTGGKILEAIANATAENRVQIDMYLEFANSALFCEWAYVVDLDQEVFEVYGCAHKKSNAVNKRFNDVGDENDTVPAFIVSFALESLPSEEGFLNCPEFRRTEEDDCEEVENGDDQWEGFDDGDDGEDGEGDQEDGEEGDKEDDEEGNEDYHEEDDHDGYEEEYDQQRPTSGPFKHDEDAEHAEHGEEGPENEQDGGNGQGAPARSFFGCVVF
jgi:hypothetical protein